ncbi:MAG: DUF2116 family Zn-ribbon domain-containing protein, partial [Acutalibacteraceae bacterium]|nr:DUF2116 family Zn-ribbon domain-containing protein [Acutalibacteraceae bacterium]
MKICEFCGKGIDYNHIFCSDECEENTFQYHKKRKKFQALFSTVSLICFATIMIGTFIGLLSQELKYGLLILGPGALVLGITYFLLPYYGIEEQIHKKGIITGQKTMRIIGLVVALVGFVCLLLGLLIQ